MRFTTTIRLAICLGLAASGALSGAPEVTVAYLYNLSDFSGMVPYSDVILHIDRQRDEIYGSLGNSVRIFSSTGMEVYRFEVDLALGQILDLVVEDSGDLLLLTYEPMETALQTPDETRQWWLSRCDYRGTPIERLEVTGLPAELEDFGPNALFYRDGLVTLASRSQHQVVTVDGSGAYQQSHDLAQLAKLEDPASEEIFGLDIDPAGNILFTIPTNFKAYVVSPDGELRQFGMAGSAPGKFGIVSGIIADDHGNILIADKLRNVVMVFDKTLRFLTEFSKARDRLLARPTDLVMGEEGKFYVTQARGQGVAVFRLTPMDPTPADQLSEER